MKALSYLERPARATEAAERLGRPLVVLLHGRAAEAETIFSIEGLLPPEFGVVAFTAPYESAIGGWEWFHTLEGVRGSEVVDESHFAGSEQMLLASLEQYQRERDLAGSPLFFWGFSQGAAMSYLVGLRGQVSPVGVVAMSGFLPAVVKRWPSLNRNPRFLVMHGTEDEVVPASLSESAFEWLRSKGVRAEYESYKGRHKMTTESIRFVNQWLSELLVSER